MEWASSEHGTAKLIVEHSLEPEEGMEPSWRAISWQYIWLHPGFRYRTRVEGEGIDAHLDPLMRENQELRQQLEEFYHQDKEREKEVDPLKRRVKKLEALGTNAEMALVRDLQSEVDRLKGDVDHREKRADSLFDKMIEQRSQLGTAAKRIEELERAIGAYLHNHSNRTAAEACTAVNGLIDVMRKGLVATEHELSG